jgi:SAM-dependent methyltransferase
MKEIITENEYKGAVCECKICGNKSNNELIIVGEKALGLGDKFEYFVCSKCSCLQIKEFPENIDRYYPPAYYSFQEAVFPSKLNRFNFFLKRSLINYYMGYFDMTGFLLSFFFENPFPWIRRREIRFDTKILDIGSGSGRKLLSLYRSGFKDLTGVDPFISNDINYENGVRILKGEASEIDGSYDFITLHHSFEHIKDQEGTFKHISRLLKPEGCALIRIPVSNSFAWFKYRENWIGLDAPRHFFLHSAESMRLLAENAGMQIDEIVFDSSAFQFTGSEKYLRNLPYTAPDNIFSKKELRQFIKEAKRLNLHKEGDAACFYLKKRFN